MREQFNLEICAYSTLERRERLGPLGMTSVILSRLVPFQHLPIKVFALGDNEPACGGVPLYSIQTACADCVNSAFELNAEILREILRTRSFDGLNMDYAVSVLNAKEGFQTTVKSRLTGELMPVRVPDNKFSEEFVNMLEEIQV